MGHLTRRGVIGAAAQGAAILSLTSVRNAIAATDDTAKYIAEFTGGKAIKTGRVNLSIPELAENGNMVPVSVVVDSPMTKDAYVKSVLLAADGNPMPSLITFNFSPMSGKAQAAARIRLAQTQNVIAIAAMSDGSFFTDRKTVKVTIGGCGG
ncbi:MAG: thiosulfate oxidation carrier protein SoxY [Afipia sp.]|nr:thiosulfate oxidation carrier protein SoxY [Afipia sp.]OJW64566.1 MAG: thiosulfate oxidation carrier protein SoxY [Afipia sp. 64-13]